MKEKITLSKHSYPNYIAITIMVGGKCKGWLQIERDNLAFYGTSTKDSMTLIPYSK